ncbi:cilia- and flagella-associated protein 45-like [Megalops cyprinoides]|uniref:cilia- and flagella-associated protein 45-like n=1 Tax=Megalops cyprinoides TaxID=118141 RepID=UPI001864A3EF|nr:cilia- and flagella-associated protein 45-like [Megalops cyprinoides]
MAVPDSGGGNYRHEGPRESLAEQLSRSAWEMLFRRYKTIAPFSFVDETLFETPKRLSLDPSERSIVISRFELERIRKAAHVWTIEEREAELEFQRREREAAKIAAEERKAKMRRADMIRKKKQGLTRLEAEAREKSLYLVERANEQRLEEDPEMKNFNKLVLGAKCCAALDAQVQEKRQMMAEEEAEERRCNAMMEEDRRAALRAQEENEELRKQERIRGKMRIQEQIEEHLEERWKQDEMKEQEKQKLLNNMEKIKMEELKALARKKEEQKRLHQEVLEMSKESQRAKERKKEEERLADIHVLEHTCKKMDQEATQRQMKKGKERDAAQLRVLQERERARAEQDEQRLRRNQEAVENEWRRKEQEQAKRKVDDKERLKATRLEQLSEKESNLAIKAARERTEFKKTLRAQSEDFAWEKEKEERRHQRAAQYLYGVRQQMREREVQAIEQRRVELQEHERLLEEALYRRAHLNEIKAKKLMELKAAGIPEKYCAKVEKKVSTQSTSSQTRKVE